MLFSVSLLGNLTSFLADVAKNHTLVTLRWLLHRGYLELEAGGRSSSSLQIGLLPVGQNHLRKACFRSYFVTLYQSEIGKSLSKSRCENNIFPIYRSVERMLEPQVANQVRRHLAYYLVVL